MGLTDCRQKVEIVFSGALNIVLNMFPFHTNAAPAILAENRFAAHAVEMPWDSPACQLLCLSIPSKSDLQRRTVGSPWRPVKEHGLPKYTCLYDLAFCGMIKTSLFYCSFQSYANRSFTPLCSEEFFIHLRQLF